MHSIILIKKIIFKINYKRNIYSDDDGDYDDDNYDDDDDDDDLIITIYYKIQFYKF